jgi:hypothetical protein
MNPLTNIPTIKNFNRNLPIFKKASQRIFQKKFALYALCFGAPAFLIMNIPNFYLSSHPYIRHMELRRDYVSKESELHTTYVRNTSPYI